MPIHHYDQLIRALVIVVCAVISGFPSSAWGDSVVVGEWTDWTGWSACNRPCGVGITHRTRECKAGTTVKGARGKLRFKCEGASIEYSTCNTKSCTTPTDFRAEQCAQYNTKLFHGKTFIWKPYLTSRPCELTCKARGQSFYVKMANKVKDGTKCSNEAGSVCVDGMCKAVGCDGVLGSRKVLDKCGVCGGRGDSCKIVTGRFTRSVLPYGYNEITIFPRGACNINVTETRYSRNYLALKVVATGKFIFNANWRIDYNGEFKSAGTLFKYMRPSNRYKPYNEHILATGPLTEAVALLVLYQQENPGITYEYTIPSSSYSGVVATSPEHSTSETVLGSKVDDSKKTISPVVEPTRRLDRMETKPKQEVRHKHRTRHHHSRKNPAVDSSITAEASQRAGGGTLAQQRGKLYQISADIAARARQDQGAQTAPYNPRGRYTTQVRPQPKYDRSRWGYGTATNRGQETYANGNGYDPRRGGGSPSRDTNAGRYDYGRTFTNGRDFNAGQDVDNYGSPYSPRYEWRVSGFTECSKTCGGGVQNSRVICVVRSSLAVVTDENCNPRRKPRPQTITCNNNACPARWVAGSWGGCSVTCGKGNRNRRVECRQSGANNADLSVSASRCVDLPKPATIESCQRAACFEWKIGDWGQCSVRCGRGTQRRDVYCSNHDQRKVREENCRDLSQPEREQVCQMKPCNSGWMYSAWQDQCSADCGSGHYVREVLCASRSGCNRQNKPLNKRSCADSAKCGAQWFTGPWSPCSDACETSQQARTVVCMAAASGRLTPLPDENCDASSKPETNKACEKTQCTAKWYMTEWSQCSATCGEAYRTRVVQCLTKDQRVATSCDREHRPPSRRECETVTCPTPPPLDPGCRDLMSRCQMVLRARLCTYKYYKQRCCHSCSRHEELMKKSGNRRGSHHNKRYT